MKIEAKGNNQTLVRLNDGRAVLYAHTTPVAVYIPGKGYFREDRFYSLITHKLINKWSSKEAIVLPIQDLQALVEEI